MFSAIETLINKTLLLDPKSKQRLKNLNGKHIKIEVRNLNIKFPIEISFHAEGLHISLPKLAVFDAIIHGPLTAFLCLAATKDPHKAAQLGLNFEGNIDVAQTAQALFMDLDIDWEEPLSKLTNDSFAHSVGQFFRTFKKRNLEMFSSLTQSMTEYLQEERKVLPSPQEAEAFYQDIELLRDRVDRSEARLLRFEKHFKGDDKEHPQKDNVAKGYTHKDRPHKNNLPAATQKTAEKNKPYKGDKDTNS